MLGAVKIELLLSPGYRIAGAPAGRPAARAPPSSHSFEDSSWSKGPGRAASFGEQLRGQGGETNSGPIFSYASKDAEKEPEKTRASWRKKGKKDEKKGSGCSSSTPLLQLPSWLHVVVLFSLGGIFQCRCCRACTALLLPSFSPKSRAVLEALLV